jgi:aldose 1-epimerase
MNSSNPHSPKTKAQIFTIKNINGLQMTVTNLGGKVMSMIIPDRHEKLDDIVLGYDTPEEYINGSLYFGAIIGRVGNRIGRGKFSLDGKEYQLSIDNGAHHLHGGPNGFHNAHWNINPLTIDGNEALALEYTSVDGECGYPGNLTLTVTYILTNNNEWIVEYSATTDQATPVNLTHHNYFNLAGVGNTDILKHLLMINGDRFTPVDAGLIPTGELRSVANTPFDFRKPTAMGAHIDDNDEQLRYGKGYDHNWVLNKKNDSMILAAVVSEPSSGRVMEIYTTEPGLQFYSGNFLDGSDIGKGRKRYASRTAFCLETQHFPDSPNQRDFPSIILKPGKKYYQKTVHRFFTEK